jgi:ankyrin repeat protein
MHFAAQLGHVEVIEMLAEFREAMLFSRNAQGRTPFDLAVIWNKLVVVKQMLKWGDPRIVQNVDDSGDSVVHHAVARGRSKILGRLLKVEEIDLDVRNKVGKTAIHIAIETWSAPITAALIHSEKCNINARDESGKTPFLLAVSLSQVKTVQAFLNNRDVDWLAQDDEGNQAVHFAAVLRTRAMAQLLKASNLFDFTVKNTAGKTPFAIARDSDKTDCAAFFRELSAEIGFVDDDSIGSDGIILIHDGTEEEAAEEEEEEKEDHGDAHASSSDSDDPDFLKSRRYRHLFDGRASSVG